MSVCHSLDIFIKELRTDLPKNPPPSLPGLRFEELRAEGIEHLKFEPGLPSADKCKQQFERGARLFGVVQSGRVLASNWINTRFADLTHINRPQVKVLAGSVYAYGIVVSETLRGQGIGRWLKFSLYEKLRREGFRYSFLAVFLKDIRVSRWHLSCDCTRWGRIFYFQRGGKDYWWVRRTETGKKYPGILAD